MPGQDTELKRRTRGKRIIMTLRLVWEWMLFWRYCAISCLKYPDLQSQHRQIPQEIPSLFFKNYPCNGYIGL